MAKPQALVLTGFGINCDYETEEAFSLAGAGAERDPDRAERCPDVHRRPHRRRHPGNVRRDDGADSASRLSPRGRPG